VSADIREGVRTQNVEVGKVGGGVPEIVRLVYTSSRVFEFTTGDALTDDMTTRQAGTAGRLHKHELRLPRHCNQIWLLQRFWRRVVCSKHALPESRTMR